MLPTVPVQSLTIGEKLIINRDRVIQPVSLKLVVFLQGNWQMKILRSPEICESKLSLSHLRLNGEL
jgi:hypothetical protein